jgi:hypothetical protein
LKFADATSSVLDAIEREMTAAVSRLDSVEAAAQATAVLLFETFPETTVLARVFVTVPFAELPAPDQAFVRRLAGPRAPRLLKANTPVLSLAGTRGVSPEWNSRYASAGHLGIPLVSMEFVESIPMISRLLKELGARLEWAAGLDTTVVAAALGSVAGLFYVEDAREAVDPQGRRIITADDFVSAYGVRTVFGFGGAYATPGTWLATVVFTRETIARREVERFLRLASAFKSATMRLVRAGAIFSGARLTAPGARR